MQTAIEFIIELEDTFGKYKTGMKRYIESALGNKQLNFDTLANYIIAHWGKQSPPPYIDIKSMARDCGITIAGNNGFEIVPICEFCYWGVKEVKNGKGKMVLQYPNQIPKNERPYKKIQLFERDGYRCPACKRTPKIGMNEERPKNG